MGVEPKTRTLKLKNIEIDPELQSRADGINESVADEYAELMKAGATFPPVRVYRSKSGTIWLAQGFHRYEAAKRAGLTDIEAEVFAGERDAADFDSAGANKDHGLRRTNKDKRRAVEKALKNQPKLSDRLIADHVGVSDKFVGKVRSEVRTVRTCDEPEKRVGKDGKEYTVAPSGVPGGTPDDGPDQAGGGGEETGGDSHPESSDDGASPAGQPDSPGASVPLPSTRTDEERAAREAAAAKLDDAEDGAGLVVSYGNADQCRAAVTSMQKALNKYQEHLSGLMSHADFAGPIRNAAKGYGVALHTDGSFQGNTAWGSVRYGVAKYSCDQLDDLFGVVGGLKVLFDRADTRPVGEPVNQPTDAEAFGAEMRGTPDDHEI